jgi:hypothetical protein
LTIAAQAIRVADHMEKNDFGVAEMATPGLH